MAKAYGQGDPEISSYVEKLFRPEDETLARVRKASLAAGLPEIQVGPMDGLLLEILMRLLRPKKVVEIGSLGGYSAVCILRGMPDDARLWAFELAEDRARLIEANVAEAGYGDRIRVMAGLALENLGKIENEGPFDAVFIDADKTGYPRYLEWAARNLRLGGVAIGDNTFGWGKVHLAGDGADDQSRMLKGLAEFNRAAAESGRFRSTIIPTAKGLTVAVKIK